MEPIEALTHLRKKLDTNTAEREQLTTQRNQLILQARQAGHTWREIAKTLDMTEHGIIKATKK